MQQGKMIVLQIAEKRREAKGKRAKKKKKKTKGKIDPTECRVPKKSKER